MYRKTLLLSLLTLLSTSPILVCIQNSTAQVSKVNSYANDWPVRCQKLKKELAKDPLVNVIYQPRPKSSNIQSSWELTWFGKRIPIPAIQYSDVFVTYDGPHNRLVSLRGTLNGQKVSVLLGVHPESAPIDDIVSGSTTVSLEGAAAPSTPAGQALTKQLFGGPIYISELMATGYNHKVADLTCRKNRWKKEIPIGIALSLKAGDGIEAAYRLDRGFVTTHSEDRYWRAFWSNRVAFADAHIKLPEGQTYGKLGLGIGQSNWQAAKDSPKWLVALETALEKPEKDNWQALAKALKEAKVSDKSIETVQKIIDTK
jgi:hypothetical protein